LRRSLAAAVIGVLLAATDGRAQADTSCVRILVLGDVNLGRTVGQRVLHGELDYPFGRLKKMLATADLVFVNLESVISDQHGSTEDPHSNLIFCAPPTAATVLRAAGVSAAGTGNNHAFDYGTQGVRETIGFLAGQGIPAAGTSMDSTGMFRPVILERHGIRVALVAYAEFLNLQKGAAGFVDLFDSARVIREIHAARQDAEVVIAMYHGGDEYASRVSARARAQMRALVDAGADVVVGHHPHVPQGMEEYRGRIIVYSIGNCVFYQPQREWTQRGWGLEFQWARSDSVRLQSIRVLPVRAGYQPEPDTGRAALRRAADRLRRLTSIPFTCSEKDSSIHVQPSFLHH
jgi:poly-gamma-glutamate capsule biosynthesis protein CapA/YwtB (metallophosphatase superfamily)